MQDPQPAARRDLAPALLLLNPICPFRLIFQKPTRPRLPPPPIHFNAVPGSNIGPSFDEVPSACFNQFRWPGASLHTPAAGSRKERLLPSCVSDEVLVMAQNNDSIVFGLHRDTSSPAFSGVAQPEFHPLCVRPLASPGHASASTNQPKHLCGTAQYRPYSVVLFGTYHSRRQLRQLQQQHQTQQCFVRPFSLLGKDFRVLNLTGVCYLPKIEGTYLIPHGKSYGLTKYFYPSSLSSSHDGAAWAASRDQNLAV